MRANRPFVRTDDETGDDDERESTEDIDDGHAEGTPVPPTELNGADGGEPGMPIPGIKASDAFDTS